MARKRRSRRSSIKKQKRYTRRQAKLLTKRLRLSSQKKAITFSPYEVQVKPSLVRRVRKEPQNERQKSIPNKYGVLTVSPKKETMKSQVCKRRQQRREIIHAINKAGQSGQRKPNNQTRDVKC